MTPQQIKAKLLAVSLFVASIGGTFAIFGCVPMLARLISPASQPARTSSAPTSSPVFPEVASPPTPHPSTAASPTPSKHARAIFSGDRLRGYSPQRRSSL